jgi:hypothetical protein
MCVDIVKSAGFCKKLGVYPGPLKSRSLNGTQEKKVRAFVRTQNVQNLTNSFVRAFPSQQHELVRAFLLKYDQSYILSGGSGQLS